MIRGNFSQTKARVGSVWFSPLPHLAKRLGATSPVNGAGGSKCYRLKRFDR